MEEEGEYACLYSAGNFPVRSVDIPNAFLFDIAGIWFKLNDLNVVEVYIFGMILESKGRRGVALYWGPGDQVVGAHFHGGGG